MFLLGIGVLIVGMVSKKANKITESVSAEKIDCRYAQSKAPFSKEETSRVCPDVFTSKLVLPKTSTKRIVLRPLISKKINELAGLGYNELPIVFSAMEFTSHSIVKDVSIENASDNSEDISI